MINKIHNVLYVPSLCFCSNAACPIFWSSSFWMFGFGSNTGKWSLGGVGDRSGDFDVDTGVDGAE